MHKAKNKDTGRLVAIKKFIEDDQTTLKIAHREVTQYYFKTKFITLVYEKD